MNIFAAIDLETTGLDPAHCEVLELAIVPLNEDFTVSSDIPEFTARIKAKHPEWIEQTAIDVNRLDPTEGKPLEGDRSHKVRLCKIWANVMRDTVISDAEEDKHMFNLSVFKNGPANLPVDPLSDVREAKIILIETDMDGKRGTRRVFQEDDRDVFQQMREELKPEAYATSLERFTTVKIRMYLDPKKYGRSKVQTVTVRLDHCDINSKNPNVQNLIMFSLKEWRACA